MVKVSVIVPVYNVEKYLGRCIESLVNQEFKDLEIILVNDKSPDNSDKIMAEYEKQYPNLIKCIYLEENLRIGGARNRGLLEAHGEYITFVDSDDWVDLDYVGKMYDRIEKTGSDIVYTDYIIAEKKKNTKKAIVYPLLCGNQDDARKKINLLFIGDYSVGCLIKKSLLIENHLLFPEKMLYEDVAICPLYAYYADRIEYVPNTYYYYFQREDSVVHDMDAEFQKDEAKTVLSLYEECKKRGIEKRYPLETEALFIKYFYAWGMNACYNKFTELPRDYMHFLVKEVYARFPNYRNNPYLYTNIDAGYIDWMFKNDDAYGYDKVPEHGVSYLDCYQEKSVKDRLCTLIPYFSKYRTVLWGAGKRGREFLQSLGEAANEISYVVDKNKKLRNTILETGNQVVLPEDALKDGDLVLITNQSFYAEIRDEIKERFPKVKIFNVYMYLLMAEEFPIEAFVE